MLWWWMVAKLLYTKGTEFVKKWLVYYGTGWFILVISALAPLPIGGQNVRFGRPTLELIFLQHGRLY